jgi:hypothetical protein
MTKLILPPGVESLSFEGEDITVTEGTIDVDGASFDMFHGAHGFKTEAEVAVEDEAAGKAAAIAAAVVTANKRK